MKKNVNLNWFCMEWGINEKRPVFTNIMYVIEPEEIIKMIKYKGKKPTEWNSIKTYGELREYLKRQFMYRFWSKSEHEMIVTGFMNGDDLHKIDVWAQIEPNLDRITEYVINEMQLKLKEV